MASFSRGLRGNRYAAQRGRSFAPVGVERLEDRRLMYAWTPEEVYLSELVNRARANPVAESARLGFDLTNGLTAGEIARMTFQEPLALNEILTQAARNHSLDMGTRNFFSHTNPDGLGPTQRVQALGYAGTAGENIAAGYSGVDAAYVGWMQSVGHRKNILSLHESFDESFHYDEFGPGFAFDAGGAYDDYFTTTFGYQGGSPDLYILGAAFNDANSSGFYGIGEGAAGIRVDVALASLPGVVLGTYTTDSAGNFQIAVQPGAYVLTFTRNADGRSLSREVGVGSINVQSSLITGDLQDPDDPPPPPSDDHADENQWPDATVMLIDPATGNGVHIGSVEVSGDTDLFRFTASVSGEITITLTRVLGALLPQMRMYNDATGYITSGIESASSSSLSINVTAGQSYYLVADSRDGGTTGHYALLIEGPTPDDPPPPPPDDYADESQWPQATIMAIDPATGDGAQVGMVEASGDTDLFRFTASITGEITITVSRLLGGLLPRVRMYSGTTAYLGAGLDSDSSSQLIITVVAGQTYYLVADSRDGGTTGHYTLLVEGPMLDDPDDPPPDPLEGFLTSGEQPLGLMHSGGQLVMTFLNNGQRPVMAVRAADGTWTSVDLLDVAGGPAIDGHVVTWTGLDGLLHIGARSPAGLVLFTQSPTGDWSFRNLQAEISGAQGIVTDLTLLRDGAGRVQVTGLAVGGDLVVFRELAATNSLGQPRWAFQDIADTNLASRGKAMPVIAGTLTSWTTELGSLNVAGVDAAGKVQMFYKQPGKRWNVVNLSTITGLPTLVGGLNAYNTPSRGVNLVGTDGVGNVWLTTWREGEGWRSASITGSFTLRRVVAGSLASYVNVGGAVFVTGINASGAVVQYRWTPAGDRWRFVNLTNQVAGGGLRVAGELEAVMTPDRRGVSIVGVNTDGAVVRYSWRPGQAWTSENVSEILAG